MCGHFGGYTWLLLAGDAITMVITLALILFCCSTKFHQLIFAMLDFFNKKGKYDALEHQLREQCADLETASKYLLHKKKMVAGVVGLNLLKLCFWYGMPYLLFAGDKNINLVETMAITALSVMLAAVIPAPAGIGSTEFVFTGLFAGIVGTGIAGSASLLYRFATFVFPFLIGVAVVITRKIRERRAMENL